MSAALTVLTLAFLPCIDDPPPKPAQSPIPAAKARESIGKTATFEMIARHTNNGTHEKAYFLDSENDYKDEANLAIVISYDHMKAFQDSGIDDPAKHYRGKRLHVTGKVIHQANQTRIRVTTPDQIKIVPEDPA
jgi:hypothetical protein